VKVVLNISGEELKKKLNLKDGVAGMDGVNGADGVDGVDGKNADETAIVSSVLSKIPVQDFTEELEALKKRLETLRELLKRQQEKVTEFSLAGYKGHTAFWSKTADETRLRIGELVWVLSGRE